MTCLRCVQVSYCSRNCQSAHWPKHKKTCNKSQSAAADKTAAAHVYDKGYSKWDQVCAAHGRWQGQTLLLSVHNVLLPIFVSTWLCDFISLCILCNFSMLTAPACHNSWVCGMTVHQSGHRHTTQSVAVVSRCAVL